MLIFLSIGTSKDDLISILLLSSVKLFVLFLSELSELFFSKNCGPFPKFLNFEGVMISSSFFITMKKLSFALGSFLCSFINLLFISFYISLLLSLILYDLAAYGFSKV